MCTYTLLIVANYILFLGAADDPKVVNKLKCSIWFVCHTKVLSDDVRLQYPRRVSFEVKYFLRYLHYIPLIRIVKTFKDFVSNFEVTLCTPL